MWNQYLEYLLLNSPKHQAILFGHFIHSVVSCSYADDHIVAFFVIVNVDKKIYRIPYNFYINDPAYLTDFTYADFSEKAGDF